MLELQPLQRNFEIASSRYDLLREVHALSNNGCAIQPGALPYRLKEVYLGDVLSTERYTLLQNKVQLLAEVLFDDKFIATKSESPAVRLL